MMQIFAKQLITLAEQTGIALRKKKWRLITAESCTGGGIAYACTAIPGSSSWYEGGFVTYSNQMKQQMLNVRDSLLREQGAVSEPVVMAMAKGALEQSNASISIAISGIAGPAGGTKSKPVGTVWVAWGLKATCYSHHFYFSGDREQIRQKSIYVALEGIYTLCTHGELCFNANFDPE